MKRKLDGRMKTATLFRQLGVKFMSQIQLPDALLQQIEAAGVTGSAVDAFVQQAVREKRAAEERRNEFFRLSSKVREAMLAQGLTEDELLADFEKQRRPHVGQAVDGFDALCDETVVSALGTHLTRDQLHERD